MRVHVRLPTVLRDTCGGRSSLDLDLGEPATVADLLDVVAAAHPALERRIRDERGVLRTHVNIFVGDENVKDLEGACTSLAPGADVSVIAAISGG